MAHLPTRGRRPSVGRALRRLSFPLRSAPAPRGAGPNPWERPTGADIDTDWARRPLATAVRNGLHRSVGRAMVAYYARPRVRGADRLSGHEDDALVFAANHHSHADTVLLQTLVPRPWGDRLAVAAAADYFFPNRAVGAVAALGIGAVPIERSKLSRRAVELPMRLLEEGWSLVLYPEGGRSKDGWAREFRPGVAFVAKMTGTPVVPVHIEGTDRVLGSGSTWPQRASTAVTFGRPMRIGPDEDVRDFTVRLEAAVAALADEHTSDWWTARRRAHAGTTPPLRGPDAPRWRRTWALQDRRPTRPRRERTWP